MNSSYKNENTMSFRMIKYKCNPYEDTNHKEDDTLHLFYRFLICHDEYLRA
jgi:hypothetical protein